MQSSIRNYSHPFCLKWHALLMAYVLIKYAHVLICISVGKGSQHFSAVVVMACPMHAYTHVASSGKVSYHHNPGDTGVSYGGGSGRLTDLKLPLFSWYR